MHLDPRLGGAEVGPAEQGQRQIDGRRVQRIDRVLQLDAQVLADIQPPRLGHQSHGQIAPESPVAVLVRLGQRGTCDGPGESKVVERLGLRVQAGLDIAQAVPPSQLGKDHADELLAASEMASALRRAVSTRKAVECLPVDEVENLGQHETAGVHGRKACRNAPPPSNASQSVSVATS
jgi:hypothetical protein